MLYVAVYLSLVCRSTILFWTFDRFGSWIDVFVIGMSHSITFTIKLFYCIFVELIALQLESGADYVRCSFAIFRHFFTLIWIYWIYWMDIIIVIVNCMFCGYRCGWYWLLVCVCLLLTLSSLQYTQRCFVFLRNLMNGGVQYIIFLMNGKRVNEVAYTVWKWQFMSNKYDVRRFNSRILIAYYDRSKTVGVSHSVYTTVVRVQELNLQTSY